MQFENEFKLEIRWSLQIQLYFITMIERLIAKFGIQLRNLKNGIYCPLVKNEIGYSRVKEEIKDVPGCQHKYYKKKNTNLSVMR